MQSPLDYILDNDAPLAYRIAHGGGLAPSERKTLGCSGIVEIHRISLVRIRSVFVVNSRQFLDGGLVGAKLWFLPNGIVNDSVIQEGLPNLPMSICSSPFGLLPRDLNIHTQLVLLNIEFELIALAKHT